MVIISKLLSTAMRRPGPQFVTIQTDPSVFNDTVRIVDSFELGIDNDTTGRRYLENVATAWSNLLYSMQYKCQRISRYGILSMLLTGDMIKSISKLEGIKNITTDHLYTADGGFVDDVINHIRTRYKGRYDIRPESLSIKPGWLPTAMITTLLGLDKAHTAGFTGKGVKVAVLDTGCSHPSQLVGKTIERERTTIEIRDDSGHGTFVISQIVGKELSKRGATLRGGAPDCEMLSVKVLQTPLGFGRASGIAAGVDKAVEWGANILNLSLGSETIDDVGADVLAIEYALGKGILVVVASGNAGPNKVGSPAHLPGVVSVGSEGTDGKIAGFSSWGTGPLKRTTPDCTSLGGSDTTDPPEYIFSSTSPLSMGDLFDRIPDGTSIMMGTSQAAPWVTSLLACAYQAGLVKTRADLTRILQKRPRTTEKGYGLLTWNQINV